MKVAGIGCRGEAPHATLVALLKTAGEIDMVAGLATRAGQIQPAAAALRLPFLAIDERDIRGVETPFASMRIDGRFGTGSVAEALALVAAGPGGEIVLCRVVSPDGQATLAVAEGKRRR